MIKDFQNSDDYKKIFTFHDSIADRIISRESSWLEFKQSFNWRKCCKYGKSMAAFANNKGGYIVFGVKDLPRELIGLQSNDFETIDEEKITSYLNGAFAPEIVFEKFAITVQSKDIGVLYTQQAKSKPVVCLKNDDNGELKESDIYYRYNARSEKIKYPELKMLFEIVKEKERKRWMELFEKISKIGPTNAAIMDTISGEISGKGGTLVIDKKLIPKLKFINEGSFQERGKPVLKLIGDVKPVSVIVSGSSKKSINSMSVQLTNDPNAPAYRKEWDESPYESPQEIVIGILKGWKHDKTSYASEADMWTVYKSRESLELDEEKAECLLESAINRHTPFFFWANLLSREQLKTFTQRVVKEGGHPAPNMALKLAHAIGGEFGVSLLDFAINDNKYPSVRSAAATLKKTVEKQDRIRRVYGAKVKIDSESISIDKVSEMELKRLKRFLDDALADTPKNKAEIKKMDALIYAPELEIGKK